MGYLSTVPSIAVEGMFENDYPTTIVDRTGSRPFAPRPDTEEFSIQNYTLMLNGQQVDEFSGAFGDTWSMQLTRGINQADKVSAYFDAVSLDESIWGDEPDGYFDEEYWQKLSTISKLIKAKDLRKSDRDFFFTSLGRWDHHSDMTKNLDEQTEALNYGLDRFVKQLKADGQFDDVTIVIASEFGRTITPNSGMGSDHGWGGHYAILGGSVKGGRILGQYPSDLTPSGQLVDGRGRLVPTTSWDAVWNGVLEWIGVEDQKDLDYCLPNAKNTINAVEGAGNFPLFRRNDLFGGRRLRASYV